MKKGLKLGIGIISFTALILGFLKAAKKVSGDDELYDEPKHPVNEDKDSIFTVADSESMEEIYLAGGCFWGLEKYFQSVTGVSTTDVGYANGNMENPTYEQVCKGNTCFAETVHIVFDSSVTPLSFLLKLYFMVIDPTALNRQGNDSGVQYRSGIYYTSDKQKNIIEEAVDDLKTQFEKPIMIEIEPLKNYYKAEKYHQKYLERNPGGYCHISNEMFELAKKIQPIDIEIRYKKADKEALKRLLSPEQFSVTQENATEPAFRNEFWDHFEPGIYVDITTGEPLFSSKDKFESGCGWPSFSKPVSYKAVYEKKDDSIGMKRTEIRSVVGDAHLGHVFDDGPENLGGLRYCINSASLRFIPLNRMKEEGYEDLIS